MPWLLSKSKRPWPEQNNCLFPQTRFGSCLNFCFNCVGLHMYVQKYNNADKTITRTKKRYRAECNKVTVSLNPPCFCCFWTLRISVTSFSDFDENKLPNWLSNMFFAGSGETNYLYFLGLRTVLFHALPLPVAARAFVQCRASAVRSLFYCLSSYTLFDIRTNKNNEPRI